MTLVDADSLPIWHDRKLLELFQAKLSPRKLRLSVAACCRLLGQLAPEGPCWHAVEAAENFADGRIDASELLRAHRAANAVCRALQDESSAALEAFQITRTPETDAAWTFAYTRSLAARACAGAAMGKSRFEHGGAKQTTHEAWMAAHREAGTAPSCDDSAGQPEEEAAGDEAWMTANLRQGEVLLDLLGNLTRPATIDRACLAWNDGAVVKLAAAIYDGPGWPDLSVGADPDWSVWRILADAVEESGCTNQDLLFHLRGPGPHVRGCAALDLLLGLK